jgi:hypothetical protein
VQGSWGDLCLAAFNAWSPATGESRPPRGRVEGAGRCSPWCAARLLGCCWPPAVAPQSAAASALPDADAPPLRPLPPLAYKQASSKGNNAGHWGCFLWPCGLLICGPWAFGPVRQWDVHVYYVYFFQVLKQCIFIFLTSKILGIAWDTGEYPWHCPWCQVGHMIIYEGHNRILEHLQEPLYIPFLIDRNRDFD